jgi:cytosine/adenosine deaminase-related metal-dependent hydrolase
MRIFSAQVVLPISQEPLFHGALAVDGGQIVQVGPLHSLRERYPGAEEVAFESSVILPGLVNAHTHLDLTAFPTDQFGQKTLNLAEIPQIKTDFLEWLCGVIKYRRSVVHQALADAIREGVDRCLRSGTTTIGEISTLDGEFSLLDKSGLRAVLFPEIISYDAERAQDSFETAVGLIEEFQERLQEDSAVGSLMRIGLSPHAPYTVSRPLLKIIQQYASESRVNVQIHVAESFSEMEFFFDGGGAIAEKLFPFVGWGRFPAPCVRKTPIEYLDSIGFLRCRPTLIHCVQVSDADLERLEREQCPVVFCPRSNHFLRVGEVPYRRFEGKKIPLALGTDGLASNASLSMWDEMRFLKKQVQRRKDAPPVFASREILRMATMGSAEALGLDHVIGSLQEGKAADFIVVRVKEDDLTEKTLFDHLIDTTHDVDIQCVAVNGRILLGDLSLNETQMT